VFNPKHHPPAGFTKIHKIQGGWSAGGHWFDDNMRCAHCQVHWDKHQLFPDYCWPRVEKIRKEKAAAYDRKRREKRRRERAREANS
jgi:hypothetical protein